MLTLQSLLQDPNPKDPLDRGVAVMYMNDRKKHDEIAAQWTKQLVWFRGFPRNGGRPSKLGIKMANTDLTLTVSSFILLMSTTGSRWATPIDRNESKVKKPQVQFKGPLLDLPDPTNPSSSSVRAPSLPRLPLHLAHRPLLQIPLLAPSQERVERRVRLHLPKSWTWTLTRKTKWRNDCKVKMVA